MNSTLALDLAGLAKATDPILDRMVIAGCSRRKRPGSEPIPALDLYEGGCVPQLRDRLGARPQLRARVRILSARHGVLTADTPISPYDQPLDPATAARLRPQTAAALTAEFTTAGAPSELLVIAEPLYLVLIADLLALGSIVHWVPDIRDGWPHAAAVLDTWGWR